MRKNRYRRQRNYKGLLIVFSGLILLAAISVGCVWGYIYLSELSCFALKKVVVSGTNRLKPETVRHMAQINSSSLINLSPQRIRHRLLQCPLIEKVRIVRKWPHTLKIIVKERNLLAMAYINNHWWWIDDKARLVLADKARFDLPVVTGLKDIDDPWIKTVVSLLKFGYKTEANWISKQISEIHVDPDMGLTLFTVDNVKVILGSNHWNIKLKRLSEVLTWAKHKNVRLKQIDLTEPKFIYAKLED